MSDKDMQEFKKEQESATAALKLMMQKGDAVTWPEARPFYMQRFNGWVTDGEPHDLVKMLDRMQAHLDDAGHRYAPKLTEREAVKAVGEAIIHYIWNDGEGNVAGFDAGKCAEAALHAAGVRFKEEA